MANFDPINVEKALRGMDFPADKETILAKARENGAREEDVNALEELPEREYDSPAEVTEALSEVGDDEDGME